MKKTSILFAALSFAALASCSKVENAEPAQDAPKTIHVTLTADAPDAPAEEGTTKVGIEGDRDTGFRTFWEEGDEVTLEYWIVYDKSTNRTGRSTLKLTSVDADGKATFQGDITNMIDNGQTLWYFNYLTALYKSSDDCLPPSQKMNGNSFDRKAAIMFSRSRTFYASEIKKDIEFEDFAFAHACTFLNIYVKELSASTISGDETVKSVTVTAPDKLIAGSYSYNITNDIRGSNGALIKMNNSAVSSITVEVPEGTKLKDLSAMAVAAPFKLDNEPLTVIIDTDKHSLKKTVNLTRDFSAAKMSAIGFKIDSSFDDTPYIEVDDNDLTFNYLGETKTYNVASNISWTVDTESLHEDINVVKKDDVLEVTLPMNKHIGDMKYAVTLVGSGVRKSIEFTQPSLWEVNEGCKVNADGSVLVGTGSSTVVPQLKFKEKTKYFTLRFKIRDSQGFSAGSAGNPLLLYRLDTKYTNKVATEKYYAEYRIGGGDDGNRIYFWGAGTVVEKTYKDNIDPSHLNKLSEISISLTSTNGQMGLLRLSSTIYFTDNTESFSSYYGYDSGPNWNSTEKGDLTISLENRGSGSLVIDSFRVVNNEKDF